MAEIVASEDVLGGKPRLEGTRIGVVDVVELLESGYSVDEAADQLDVSEGAVRAALEYSDDNQAEIEATLRRRADGPDTGTRSGRHSV
jgi:uncharacterized protein (DUF433 family)